MTETVIGPLLGFAAVLASCVGLHYLGKLIGRWANRGVDTAVDEALTPSNVRVMDVYRDGSEVRHIRSAVNR